MGKQWKKAGKMEASAKKGAVTTKIAREIQVATKMGGGDPNFNPRLRLALDLAKKNSVTNDTIERSIKKGLGQLDDGKTIDETTYEGYGPHGVGVIVECQTDNKNRTAAEMRTIFKTHGGGMGETNSVSWMFERVCLIEAVKAGTFDPEEEAIEAGANEVVKNDSDEDQKEITFSFYGSIDQMENIRSQLQGRGWKVTAAELSFKAKNLTELTEEQLKDVQECLQEFEDFDDSHRVYATLA